MEFLQVLYINHRRGEQMNLNGHYMPQHLGGFRHVAPSKWDVVTMVKDPHLKTLLERIVGGKNTTPSTHHGDGGAIEQMHASGQTRRGMGLSPPGWAITGCDYTRRVRSLGSLSVIQIK